jgi:hypothetical protein
MSVRTLDPNSGCLGDDGVRAGSIVLDMRAHDLTFAQRRMAVDVLFSWRDWS